SSSSETQGVSPATRRSGRMTRSAVLLQLEPEQPARNLAVEERNLFDRLQVDLSSQGGVTREDKGLPARAALLQHFAKLSIQRSQLFLLAEAFAIGRIAQDRSRRSGGRLEVIQVLLLETNQVADAGGASVGLREGERITANV